MVTASFVAPLLLALAPVAPFTRGAQDDLLAEFQRYFKKYEDTPTRVEAVLSLEDVASPDVVGVLADLIPRAEPEVRRAVVRVLGAFETPAQVTALFAELEDARREPTRLVLLEAIEAGGYRGGEPVLAELLGERSWPVRYAAIEALCALVPNAVAAEIDEDVADGTEPWDRARIVASLTPLVGDSEPAVRCAVLEGLAALQAHEVLVPARRGLDDGVWQVRACAIRALGTVRDRDSIEPLLARMELEDGRLREDVGAALGELTGRNFGDRLDAWQRFWETFGEGFVMPTDEEREHLRRRQARAAAEYRSNRSAFHGIETASHAIVFVIDVSGSMESLMVERERFADADYPSLARIDIVKTELARTIEALESHVEFNILAFATEVDAWKKRPVRANVLNRSSAAAWVERLRAIGGTSQSELAAAGLGRLANLEGGKTNTHGALMAALEAPAPGEPDRDYEVDIDTVYFLSDGRPSHGSFVDIEDILREVREKNALRQVVIHTIALGEFDKNFMRALARQNRGTFVDLGR